MNVDETAARYSDPILAIAKDILAEYRHRDISAQFLSKEIWRRYHRDRAGDQYMAKYACNGGLGGLSRRLLKRPIRLSVGPSEVLTVPERLNIGHNVYRPTLICTESELSHNTRSKRQAIAYDVRAVRPLERLAELMRDAGEKTVEDTFTVKDDAA
jgi:hypothetical protein